MRFKIFLDQIIQGLRRHWVILLPFLWYFGTAARTITHGDAALNVDAIAGPIVSTHVNNHNVSVLVGWLLSHLLPFGSIAFRDTFQAIFFGGLTVALFYFLVYHIFRSRVTASIAAWILTVSHSLWWHSTVIESAGGNACFMMLALWWVVLYHETRKEKYLLLMVMTAGVGVFQHAQLGVIGLGAAVLAVAHVYYLFRGRSYKHIFRFVLRAAGVSVLALAPYVLTLIIRDAPIAGGVAQAFHAASGGSFQQFMFQGSTLYGLTEELYLVGMQFPSPFLILLPAGLWFFLRRWKITAPALATLVMCFVNAWFFIYFNTWDRFEFMLISFVVMAFWGSFALDRLVRLAENLKHPGLTTILVLATIFSVAFPPYLYAHLAIWGRSPSSYWYARYNNAYSPNSHDIAALIANPDKHNYLDVDQYAHALFDKLPASATYIDDDSRTYYQVQYFRTYYHERPDLRVNFLNSWNIPNWGLDAKTFIATLEAAYQTNGDLFLISTAHPYAEALASAPRRYQFREFPLPYGKWAYRLVTASDASETSDWDSTYIPKNTRVLTGLGFETGPGTVRDSFNAQDRIMTRFYFAPNPQPFSVSFKWTEPNGAVHHLSTEFLVPAGNTEVWSYLEGPSERPAGSWKLEVIVNQTVVATKTFEVR